MAGIGTAIFRTVTTASNSIDPYPNNVTFLCHFDGTQGATTGFRDDSWNNLTSSQAVSATQNTAFTATTYFQGQSSIDLTNSTNYNVATRYFGINWAVPTGTTATIASTVCDMSRDFTIEGWIYWTSLPASGSQAYWIATDCVNNFTYSASINGIRPGCRDNGELIFYMDNGTDVASPAQGTAGSVIFSTGVWQHFAIVKSGTTMGHFINGTSATGSWVQTITARTHSQGFGFVRTGVDSQKAGGPYYLDEVRITSGVARYTPGTNFTVDSSSRFPLPTDPYKQYVTTHFRFENNFTDYSQKQLAWTQRGTLAYNTGGSQAFGSYCASPRANSPSGTSSCLYVSTSSDTTVFSPGTGDFTIEGWVYRSATNSGYGVMFDSRPFLTASTSPTTGTYAGLYIGWDGTNIATYQQGGSVAFGTSLSGNIAHGMATTTWCHVAVARASGVCKIFINGVQKASFTDTTNYGFNTTSGAYAGTAGQANTYCRFGEANNASNNNNGANFDEIRITVGVARYTAAFAAPTAPFPGE